MSDFNLSYQQVLINRLFDPIYCSGCGEEVQSGEMIALITMGNSTSWKMHRECIGQLVSLLMNFLKATNPEEEIETEKFH